MLMLRVYYWFFVLMALAVCSSKTYAEQAVTKYVFPIAMSKYSSCMVYVGDAGENTVFKINSPSTLYLKGQNVSVVMRCRPLNPNQKMQTLLPTSKEPVDLNKIKFSKGSQIAIDLGPKGLVAVAPETSSVSVVEPADLPVAEVKEVGRDPGPRDIFAPQKNPKSLSHPAYRPGGYISAGFYLGQESLDAKGGLSEYSGETTIGGTRIDTSFCLSASGECKTVFDIELNLHNHRILGVEGKTDEETSKSLRISNIRFQIEHNYPVNKQNWFGVGIGAKAFQQPFFKSETTVDGNSELDLVTSLAPIYTVSYMRLLGADIETQNPFDLNSLGEKRIELGYSVLPTSLFDNQTLNASEFFVSYIWQTERNEYFFGVKSFQSTLKAAFPCSSRNSACNPESEASLKSNALFLGLAQSI